MYLIGEIIQLDSIGAKREVEVRKSTPDRLSPADSAPSQALPHRPLDRRSYPSPGRWFPFNLFALLESIPVAVDQKGLVFNKISCPSMTPSSLLSAGVGSGPAPFLPQRLNRRRRYPHVARQCSKAKFSWSYSASLGDRPRGHAAGASV